MPITKLILFASVLAGLLFSALTDSGEPLLRPGLTDLIGLTRAYPWGSSCKWRCKALYLIR